MLLCNIILISRNRLILTQFFFFFFCYRATDMYFAHDVSDTVKMLYLIGPDGLINRRLFQNKCNIFEVGRVYTRLQVSNFSAN